jgi:hypothetical protein
MLHALWNAILMVVVLSPMLMILIMLHTYEESDRRIELFVAGGLPLLLDLRAQCALARLKIVRDDLRLA